jgi:hypothetical protein
MSLAFTCLLFNNKLVLECPGTAVRADVSLSIPRKHESVGSTKTPYLLVTSGVLFADQLPLAVSGYLSPITIQTSK